MDLFFPTPPPSLFKVNLRRAPLRRTGEKGAAARAVSLGSSDQQQGDPLGQH